MAHLSATVETLNERIRQALEEHNTPDPHVIATHLFNILPPEDLGQLAREGLVARLRAQMSQMRNRKPTTSSVNSKPENLSYTQSAAWREFVPGKGWKFFGDLTIEDALAIAEDAEAMAGTLLSKANGFRSLAEVMATGQLETASQLPEALIGEIFS